MKIKTLLLLSAFALPLVSAPFAQASAQEAAPPAPEAGAKVQPPHHCGMMQPRLSEEGRKIIHEGFEKSRADNKATFEAFMRAKKEAEALLAAEKFEKDAYLKKVSDASKLKQILDDSRAEALADIAAKLSPQDRKAFAHPPMMLRHPGPGPMHGEGMQQGGKDAHHPMPPKHGKMMPPPEDRPSEEAPDMPPPDAE